MRPGSCCPWGYLNSVLVGPYGLREWRGSFSEGISSAVQVVLAGACKGVKETVR